MILPKVNSPRIQRIINSPIFLRALYRPLKITSKFDIPYLAGYNRQGTIIFFDRHFNPYMRWKGKRIDVRPFITLHEVGENCLLNYFGFNYQQAHHIITHVELAVVKNAGIDTRAYNRFLNPQIKGIHNEKLKKVPKNLDLRPYADEHEQSILQSLQQGKDIRDFTRRVSKNRRRH